MEQNLALKKFIWKKRWPGNNGKNGKNVKKLSAKRVSKAETFNEGKWFFFSFFFEGGPLY
jgi:hypothetical protein